MTAWLSAAAELDAFEGIRRGDEGAFRAVAEPLQPTLRRLARLYVDSETRADAVVLRTWELALHGLQMFAWRSPLATWIAGITVTSGRARDGRASAGVPHPIGPAPVCEVAGPQDWSDLPWGERWAHAGATLADALAGLPTAQREIVHGRHLEQWPRSRVCDVFGLPEAAYERLLSDSQTRLHDALSLLVGQPGPSPHRPARIAAITQWLTQLLDARPEQLDPRTVALFRRWSGRTRPSRLSFRGNLP